MGSHQEIPNENIYFKNETSFEKKLENFRNAYIKNKKSVAVVTDFDYTITARYNYKDGTSFKSTYYLYDDDIIGGNQKKLDDAYKDLAINYAHYEFSTEFDFETKNKKTKEWYEKSLALYANERLTKNSIDEMVKLKLSNILFRSHVKKYLEILLKLEIPIIIESGGITQFIISVLKTIIKDVERYIEEKKIIIISNSFKFDEKTNKCIGLEHEVIYCFNKAKFLGDNVKKLFPELTHILVLGDNLGDADSVKNIDVMKENILGFGFLNLEPKDVNDNTKKEFIDKKIDEYKELFDVVLVGDIDYQPIIDYLQKLEKTN